jgi:hypothetical protein
VVDGNIRDPADGQLAGSGVCLVQPPDELARGRLDAVSVAAADEDDVAAIAERVVQRPDDMAAVVRITEVEQREVAVV